ncbi:MAG: hypothetical protein HYY17_10140 [Planctomycetes bacterium]|nr:hypothetical protein [Planctomycetota bacterium]
MRKLMSAAPAIALLLAESIAWAQEEPSRSESRECRFQAHNPVILRVGECEEIHGKKKWISVLTNTRTVVSLRNTNYVRYERDCEGNVLQTFDTIPAVLSVRFHEIVLREDGGAELEVKPLGDSLWCVNPHRGGYRIGLALSLGERDLADDAGCYVATATVTVTAEPFEDCKEIEPPDGSGDKGNNGVGNGEDPQPPGDPPINDGPGTGPGNPGNQGGQH